VGTGVPGARSTLGWEPGSPARGARWGGNRGPRRAEHTGVGSQAGWEESRRCHVSKRRRKFLPPSHLLSSRLNTISPLVIPTERSEWRDLHSARNPRPHEGYGLQPVRPRWGNRGIGSPAGGRLPFLLRSLRPPLSSGDRCPPVVTPGITPFPAIMEIEVKTSSRSGKM
jgi:hypothetical protein